MPDFKYEKQYAGAVAGIDEAGRGPWAGPVVAGAVVIKDKTLPPDLLEGLDDSKKLSPAKREKMYERLRELQKAGIVDVGIGEASCEEIDRLNILQATFLAMSRAFAALHERPGAALVDGNQKPAGLPAEVQTVVKGDAKSYSIAAASVAAKVWRDHYMAKLAEKYPFYGFEKNAGYGTKAHVEGLKKYGVVEGVHRKSYKPVRAFLKDEKQP